MKIPKWSVIPLFTIVILLGVMAVALVSGCISNDMTAIIDRGACEVTGGLWIEEAGECCPKGCPLEPISETATTTAAEEALIERCNVCWL